MHGLSLLLRVIHIFRSSALGSRGLTEDARMEGLEDDDGRFTFLFDTIFDWKRHLFDLCHFMKYYV